MCETQNGRLLWVTKISSMCQSKALVSANRLASKFRGSERNTSKNLAAKNSTWLTWLVVLHHQITPIQVKIDLFMKQDKLWPDKTKDSISGKFWLALGQFAIVTTPIKSIKWRFLLRVFSMSFLCFLDILVPIDSPSRGLSFDVSNLSLWLK